jgi:hypothetical protein
MMKVENVFRNDFGDVGFVDKVRSISARIYVMKTSANKFKFRNSRKRSKIAPADGKACFGVKIWVLRSNRERLQP